MKKLYLKSLECIRTIDAANNTIYFLPNGDCIKAVKRDKVDEKSIKTIERKVLYADNLFGLSHLAKPKYAIYTDEKNPKYFGYGMKSVQGINFDGKNIIHKEADKYDLFRYAMLYLKAEKIVKEANKQGIIMPDLLSSNNVLITKDDQIEFVDYDDMQIGPYQTEVINGYYIAEDNSGISIPNLSDKYYTKNMFNNNIDKKSLLYLYLENTFGITPDVVEKLGNNKKLMQFLGINDECIMNKFGVFFDDNPKVDNEYLGSTTIDIANKYELRPGRHDTKSLYKKR